MDLLRFRSAVSPLRRGFDPAPVSLPRVDDLVATVQIAADLGIPITARGGGTSLSGQSIGRVS